MNCPSEDKSSKIATVNEKMLNPFMFTIKYERNYGFVGRVCKSNVSV